MSKAKHGAPSTVITVPIGKLKANPSNPRVIRDEKFTKLVRSLVRFPTMLEKRPIVHVERVVLGGNQRLRAIETILGDWKKAAAHLQGLPDRERGVAEAFWAEAVKHKALPASCIADASGWTDEQRREFIIKDNVGFGEHDWDALVNEWNADDLSDWGLDLPVAQDFTNKEVDTDGFGDEVVIKLHYSEADHAKVRDALSRVASTPEQAVWKLLGLK